MLRTTLGMMTLSLSVALVAAPAAFSGDGAKSKDRAPDDPTQVLSFTMDRLDGAPEKLEDYRGKVVLVVNTASKCGFTPQYAGLEKLYEKYKDRGFVVLGFPANNFGHQEPGTDSEISTFCTKNYGVTFPMFSKISVMGDGQHPLYSKLTGAPAPIGGPVKWNFQKYLVDRSGHVVEMFPSPVKPMDPKVTGKIGELLKEKS